MQDWVFHVVAGSFIAVYLATAIVTIGGLIGKFEVEKKFLWLFSTSLLVETGVALFGLFSSLNPEGSDSFSQLPQEIRGETAVEVQQKLTSYAASIEARVRSENAASLEDVQSQLTLKDQQIGDMGQQIAGLELEVSELEDDFQKVRNTFVFRLLLFHKETQAFGDSLNLIRPARPEKTVLARELLHFLAEVGYYTGPENLDTEAINAILMDYQRSKNFGTVGWYSRDVFIAILFDHFKSQGAQIGYTLASIERAQPAG